jgi:hypothetical protein
MTSREQINILCSPSCYCGRAKNKGHAVCRECFAKLTKAEKDSLFLRIPAFGTSYESCVAALKQRARLTPSPRYVDPRRRAAAGGR